MALSVLAVAACGDDDTGTTDTTVATDTNVATDSTPPDSTPDDSATETSATETTPEETSATETSATETEDTGDTGDTSEAETTPTLTAQAFCDALPTAVCDWIQHCFAGSTAAQCTVSTYGFLNFYKTFCQVAPTEVAAGRLVFDPARGQACLDAHHATVCEFPPPVVRGTNFNDPEAACAGVFTGGVAVGGDCYFEATRGSDECSGGICSHAGGVCPGECVGYVALGGTCNGSSLVCDPGTGFCKGGTCAAKLGAGASCVEGGSNACAAGLACISNGAGGVVCAQQAGEGGACDYNGQCRTTGLCVDHVCTSHAVSGGTCNSTPQCPTGEHCIGTSMDSPLTCTTPAAQGESCSRLFGSESCADGLTCFANGPDQGTCEPWHTVGQDCDGPGCDVELWCRATTDSASECTAKVVEGGACVDFWGPNPRACDDGLICMYDGKCHGRGALGAPCNPTRQDSCVDGLQCDRADDTCQPPSADGAMCNPLWGSACVAGTYCECLDDPGCQNGIGDQANPREICQPKLADGEACLDPRQCVSQNCSGKTPEDLPVCVPAPVQPVTGCVGP